MLEFEIANNHLPIFLEYTNFTKYIYFQEINDANRYLPAMTNYVYYTFQFYESSSSNYFKKFYRKKFRPNLLKNMHPENPSLNSQHRLLYNFR